MVDRETVSQRHNLPGIEASMYGGLGVVPGVAGDLAQALKEPHGRVQQVVGHDCCAVHDLGGVIWKHTRAMWTEQPWSCG